MRYIALSSLIALALLFGSVARAAEKAEPPQSKSLVAISGADSHVRKPTYERITTPEDWSRVWTSHLGTTKDNAYRSLFEIDFDRCLVVAIFRGEEARICGIQIESLSESADSIVIRFVRLGYQTAGSDNDKPPDRPYAFVVIPKTEKTIVLEQRLRTMGDQQQFWQECGRLAEGQALGQQSVKPSQ